MTGGAPRGVLCTPWSPLQPPALQTGRNPGKRSTGPAPPRVSAGGGLSSARTQSLPLPAPCLPGSPWRLPRATTAGSLAALT